MAEGFARHLKPHLLQPYSAGIQTHGLNPFAVQVMAEAGVDISHQQSKTADTLQHIPFHYVITVCSHAHETCPTWLGQTAQVLHVPFDDPPLLAKTAPTPEEALNIYRRVRDQIAAFIQTLPDALNSI